MNVDYRKFQLFIYESTTSPDDKFRLGDLVQHKKSKEIGVILQVHSPDEYRTDMFGNCSSNEIKLATQEDMNKRRKDLVDSI